MNIINNVELYILKLLFSYESFLTNSPHVDHQFLKETNKELHRIYQAISAFHSTFVGKGIASVDELEVFFYSQFPSASNKDRQEQQVLFNRLREIVVDEAVASEYIRMLKEKNSATKLALLGLEVSDGRKTFKELVESFQSLSEEQEAGDAPEFVSSALETLQNSLAKPGLNWRLKALREMLGPLRKGNFGFVFARPETGKTTFLASEATHMLQSVDTCVLWFNNEQAGDEVVARCMQAYFGITTQQLFGNFDEYRKQYDQETQGKLKIYDNASIHRTDVERICRKFLPSLIIFDQIDKIKGFANDRHDLELKALYQWARELAKLYGPVIAVCQAGVTGEGKKWLTMDDVDNSKTSKQGEADWILGIGKSHQEGMGSIRHLHLSKNKLLGDSETKSSDRHGRRDVILEADIARYRDI